jgi:hypothetical protein
VSGGRSWPICCFRGEEALSCALVVANCQRPVCDNCLRRRPRQPRQLQQLRAALSTWLIDPLAAGRIVAIADHPAAAAAAWSWDAAIALGPVPRQRSARPACLSAPQRCSRRPDSLSQPSTIPWPCRSNAANAANLADRSIAVARFRISLRSAFSTSLTHHTGVCSRDGC